MRRFRTATFALVTLTMTVDHAFAETIAVIAICQKGQKICNKATARSVCRIPLDGSICFVPIQQKLAELGVYDEKQDDIRISCETKTPS